MKLIILDRDGVINYDSEHYIKTPEECLPIPGSLEAIGRLKQLGYTIAVATNQSGIARGLYSELMLQKINQKLQDCAANYQGKIDFFCYCPHHPNDNCNCRKPKIGMFERIQQHFNCSLDNCFFVGDSFSDIEVAKIVGCIPVLVKTGKGKMTLETLGKDNNILVYENLLDFVKHLC